MPDNRFPPSVEAEARSLLQRLKQERGLTYAALGAMVGVSARYVEELIRRGSTKPLTRPTFVNFVIALAPEEGLAEALTLTVAHLGLAVVTDAEMAELRALRAEAAEMRTTLRTLARLALESGSPDEACELLRAMARAAERGA